MKVLIIANIPLVQFITSAFVWMSWKILGISETTSELLVLFLFQYFIKERERVRERERESEREKRGGERWKKEKTNKYCEIPRKSIKCLSYQFFQSDKNIARHIISGEIFQSKSLLQNLGCF